MFACTIDFAKSSLDFFVLFVNQRFLRQYPSFITGLLGFWIELRHVTGTNYTDILVRCLLDYGEPNGQRAFDTAPDYDDAFIFDELGLRGYSPSGTGQLLTHVIFHPVQKSLNRLIEIDYTVRVQSLAG